MSKESVREGRVAAFTPSLKGQSTLLLAMAPLKWGSAPFLMFGALLVFEMKDRLCPYFPSDIGLVNLMTLLNPLFIRMVFHKSTSFIPHARRGAASFVPIVMICWDEVQLT